MTSFPRLRSIIWPVALLCLLAGVALLSFIPAASRTSPESPKPQTPAGEQKAPTDPGGSRLILCPLHECGGQDGSSPPQAPPRTGEGRTVPCSPGNCPSSEPDDGVVHCMALGCPTDEGPEQPVSNDGDPSSRRPGSSPQDRGRPGGIDSFEECVDAGYPVAESYPEQCVSPDGTFTRPAG